MGNNSPGKIKKQGREAFDVNVDPMDICPYKNHTKWDNDINQKYWLEGWNESQDLYFQQHNEYKPTVQDLEEALRYCFGYIDGDFKQFDIEEITELDILDKYSNLIVYLRR